MFSYNIAGNMNKQIYRLNVNYIKYRFIEKREIVTIRKICQLLLFKIIVDV